jgi:hypothetical protein
MMLSERVIEIVLLATIACAAVKVSARSRTSEALAFVAALADV